MQDVRPDWGTEVPCEDVSGAVAVIGVAESDHARNPGRSTQEIALEAVERALDDAGLEAADIDGLMHAALPGQLGEREFRSRFGSGGDLWVSEAGGPGAMPFHEAALALRAGKARYILNSYAVAWATLRGSMVGGPGDAHAHDPFKRNLELPFGWFPQPVYFAAIARRHMHEFGTREEQLGAVAVSARRHANRTPGAVMHRTPLSIEQYRSSRLIAAPFRREDCCLISDGGGAYILTTPERARDARKPAIELGGVGEGTYSTGWQFTQQGNFTATPQVFAAPRAFAMAGITPADVDVYACYDAFTILTLMQLEDSGFCAKGEAGPFAASAGLDFDTGTLPTNTHGGLLSHAYINGIAHVIEIVRQLRGEAAAQVENASLAAYGSFTGASAATLVLRRT